jgi:chromosome partitioning protein
MILTITSRKGGCGKTVLAMLVASSLAEHGEGVALVDADPNGSVHRWATDIRQGAATIAPYAEADADRLAELLPDLAEQHAIVVVDTAGFGNRAATVAAAAADLVLVPVAPGEADVIEASRMIAAVGGLARSTRRPIPALVVINRVRRNTTLARHIATEVDRLQLPRLATTLSEAVAYGELSFSGTLPTHGTPAEEIAGLMDELRQHGVAFQQDMKV